MGTIAIGYESDFHLLNEWVECLIQSVC